MVLGDSTVLWPHDATPSGLLGAASSALMGLCHVSAGSPPILRRTDPLVYDPGMGRGTRHDCAEDCSHLGMGPFHPRATRGPLACRAPLSCVPTPGYTYRLEPRGVHRRGLMTRVRVRVYATTLSGLRDPGARYASMEPLGR